MANRLLAALPESAYRRLLPDLEATTFQVGDVLIRPAEPLEFVYFPTDSVVTVSYAVNEEGAMAKAWPVGNEGMVGISLILGGLERDKGADIQIGGTAFRLPAAALLREFGRAGALQHLLLRYVLPSSRRPRNWAYVVITIPLNNDCAVSCRVSLIELPARKSPLHRSGSRAYLACVGYQSLRRLCNCRIRV